MFFFFLQRSGVAWALSTIADFYWLLDFFSPSVVVVVVSNSWASNCCCILRWAWKIQLNGRLKHKLKCLKRWLNDNEKDIHSLFFSSSKQLPFDYINSFSPVLEMWWHTNEHFNFYNSMPFLDDHPADTSNCFFFLATASSTRPLELKNLSI